MRFLITVLIFCVPVISFAQGLEDVPGLLQHIIQRKGYTCDNVSKVIELPKDLVVGYDASLKAVWGVDCKNNRKGNISYSVYMYKSTRIKVCNGSSCR